jgi:protein ImuA
MALRSLPSTLLENFGDTVWRADALACAPGTARVLPSGHAALDAQLPGGGWPVGALCELLQAQAGQAEWRLLLPTLRTLGQTVALVGAPFAPFGPGLAAQGLDVRALLWVQADALAQRLWAAEQLLRCAGIDALLLWLPQVRAEHLRRLQQAAQTHTKLLFVMRPTSAQHEASPAALRLLVGAPGIEAQTVVAPTAAVSVRVSQTAATPERAMQAMAVSATAAPELAASAQATEPSDALALPVRILKRRGPPLTQTLLLCAHPATLRVLLAACATQLVSPSATQLLPSRDLQLPERDHALDRLANAA